MALIEKIQSEIDIETMDPEANSPAPDVKAYFENSPFKVL